MTRNELQTLSQHALDIKEILLRIAEALERSNRADIERVITAATGRPANLSKGE